jgi:hypothetical protein
MIVARGLGRGAQGQLLVTLGLGLDSAAVTPPPAGHGRSGSRGFLPEKRKRRDTDDDLLILIL